MKKVFVVDDDDFFRQMLVDHLSKSPGLKITPFSTGEECIAGIYNEKPDIVVLDYTLNDVVANAASGIEILDQIKKLFPAIHVIMLSGQGKYGVAASTIVKGAEHYVVKDNDSFKNIATILQSYN